MKTCAVQSLAEHQGSLTVVGHCALSPDQLRAQFLNEGAESLISLPGQFVLVIEDAGETHLVTSSFGVEPYFYTVRGGEFHHGATVQEVARNAALPWQWNFEALSDFIQLDHTLGSATLHEGIERTPPGSVVHFRAGRVDVRQLPWKSLVPSGRSSPQGALHAFNEEIARWFDEKTMLSMSGGFDSRVILSALLAQGRRVPLVVMGNDDASDVILSRAIAERFGLECSVVRIENEDYLAHGHSIANVCNGACSAMHWHAFLYLKKLNLAPDTRLLVGTNGEFCRSFFLTSGYDAIRAAIHPRQLRAEIWKPLLAQPFLESERSLLAEPLQRGLSEAGVAQRTARLDALCDAPGARGLDKFYLRQRVPNHTALGLRMMADSVEWRTPFLAGEWVRQVWNLHRYWKVGANWHRFAIEQNFPELMEFPIGAHPRVYSRDALRNWISPRWLRRVRNLRRLASRRPAGSKANSESKRSPKHYANPSEVFRSDSIREYLCDNAAALSDLCQPSLVRQVVEEHRQNGQRARTVAWLLTMALWIAGRSRDS